VTALEPELFRTVDVADVYKGGVLAARLCRTGAGVEFAYVDGYEGAPVATTLAVGEPPRLTTAGAVPPFFAGLLPEGRRLSSLRRAIKTSADDELSLLLAVGRDTIGDVVVVPEGAKPEAAPPVVVGDGSFADIEFADLLAEAGIVDPVGLPGVQDKVSARVIAMPIGTPDDRFILKLDPPEYPHVVENEAFFLGLARRAGLPVAEATVVTDATGRTGLLVRRFDRVPTDGGIRAVACEDACQLLDRWPGDKYNVTAEAVADAVIRVCPARAVAARDIFRQVCFAWLTANGDGHAKNISVLQQPGGEWRVAPAYDLPSTAPYGDRTLALPVSGTTKGLSRRKLLEFAARIGLTEKAAHRVIDEQLAATATLADDLADGALPFDKRTTAETVKVLRYRRRLVAT
jgi:serine/threonine-protein kinase HipA